MSSATAAPAVSLLSRPDWWWWLGLALSVGVAIRAHRRGLRAWAWSYLGMVVTSAAVIAALMHSSSSSWELLKYYPAKTLWTATVVVVPVASAGLVLIGSWAWRSRRLTAGLSTVVRAVWVLGIGVLVIGVLGRGSAFPPHLATIAQGRSGPPNWSLGVIEELAARGVAAPHDSGALVLGVVPSADLWMVRGGYVGVVDSMAMEALDHLGWREAFADPVKVSLATRDLDGVCMYLMRHPNALRVTGPNPVAGPGWLMESGCPRSVVKPEAWISLRFGSPWLERSAWEGQGGWDFPSFTEISQLAGKA